MYQSDGVHNMPSMTNRLSVLLSSCVSMLPILLAKAFVIAVQTTTDINTGIRSEMRGEVLYH